MDSLPIPPITRFDAVMWFLRVQLWVIIANFLLSLSSSGIAFLPLLSLPSSLRPPLSQVPSSFGGYIIPILVLWVFPALLASNALGETARDPISSLSGLRSLILRCAGLSLFVSSLSRVLGASVYIVINLATRGTLFFSSSGSLGSRFIAATSLSNLGVGIIPLLLGFVLAFGPAIRDALRPR